MTQNQKEQLIPEQYNDVGITMGEEKHNKILSETIVCEFCKEPIEDEDEHNVGPVDDSLTICDACYEHLH